MERPYTGLTARIKINGTTIGYLNSLDLSFDKEVTEILQFGAEYKEKVPGIKNWTASAEGTVAFSSGEGQHKLYEAYVSGEWVELTVMLDSVTNFTGQALITALNISGAPDDALNLSAEFEGSGGVVLTLPQTYFLDISSGVGGTTDKGGNIRAVAGESFTVKAIAAIGMKPSSYTDNGTETTFKALDITSVAGRNTATVTIAKVAEDHILNFKFTKDATAT